MIAASPGAGFGLRSLVRLSPRLVGLALAAGVVAGTGTVAVVAQVEAAVAAPDEHRLARGATFVLVAAGVLLTGTVAQRLLVRLAQQTVFDLRLATSRSILALTHAEVERLGTGPLLACLTQDAVAVSSAIVALPLLITNLAIIVALLAYLLTLSWQLAVFTVAMAVLGVLAYRVFATVAARAMAEARDREDRLFGALGALTSGIRELQFGAARRRSFDAHLSVVAKEHREAATRGLTLFTAAWTAGQLSFLLLIGSLLFVAPSLVEVDRRTLAGFTFGVLYLSGPLAGAIGAAPTMSAARVAMAKLGHLGFVGRSVLPPDAGPSGPPPVGELRAEGVSYRYPTGGEAFCLGPVDLSARAGSVLFLVGGNGSGKTTLVKVLTGLYPPSEGRLSVDGRALDPARLDHYRESVSVVFGDPFVFPSALVDAARPDHPGRVATVLDEVGLTGKVDPDDPWLPVDELSLGHRKRLALAVVLLEDRPVVVLDEWAAEQDVASREWFYRTLLPRLRTEGRVVVVVSHDDRYFDVADQVVRLERGVAVSVAAPTAPSASIGAP